VLTGSYEFERMRARVRARVVELFDGVWVLADGAASKLFYCTCCYFM